MDGKLFKFLKQEHMRRLEDKKFVLQTTKGL